MARAADGNAGGKIQEPIAVNVPDFDAATMRHHERVFARIGGRYYFGVASQYCPRFGSRQFRPDGVTAIGILVHAVDLACSTDGREVFLGLKANVRRAAGPRLSRLQLTIVADDRGIKIAKAINLRRTKKADIDPASLQPIGKNFW